MARIQPTKEEIKKLMKMWDTKSLDELEKEMNWPRRKISHLAYQIRKLGYKLASKRVNGELRHLIAEAIDEL